jgi:hypothetical protein
MKLLFTKCSAGLKTIYNWSWGRPAKWVKIRSRGSLPQMWTLLPQ